MKFPVESIEIKVPSLKTASAEESFHKKILSILKKPQTLISFVQDRPGHDRRYSVDAKKLYRLGWRPRYSLAKKLPETVLWYQKNKSRLHGIMNQSRVNKHISS